MQYLTAPLLARFRSEDEAIAGAAAAEWMQACQRYDERLREIRPLLPRGVRGLLRRFSLHDARVLAMTADAIPYFSIFLQLRSPADPRDEFLELRYRLAGGLKTGLRLIRHRELAADGKPLGWVLYDEVDVAEKATGTALVHSILFTGGYELQLSFYGLTRRRIRFLYPPTGGMTEEPEKAIELLTA